MKIVLIGPVYPYRGGISHYTTQLATKLEEKGNSVLVISFSRQYPAWLYPGETDKDPSEQAVKFPAKFLLDPLYPWTWFRAYKEIAAFKPDVVLPMWWTTFWAPAYALLIRNLIKTGFHVTYLIHNVFPHEAKFFDKFLTKIALSCAKSFIVQTQDQEKLLRSLLPSVLVQLSSHPVYDFFGKKISREDACLRLNINPQNIILLFFGIIRPYKGLSYLIEAISIVKKTEEKVTLIIAGEFWDSRAMYQDLIQKCGIQDQVKIFNRYIENEEVPIFFSAADIFVAPYINGTQSGVINIARFYNLPIIMTKVIAESAGLDMQSDIPVKDPEALAKAILRIIHNPNLISENQDNQESWRNLIDAIKRSINLENS